MSDIWSGTNKNGPDLLKFCLVCLAGPAINDNTEFIIYMNIKLSETASVFGLFQFLNTRHLYVFDWIIYLEHTTNITTPFFDSSACRR